MFQNVLIACVEICGDADRQTDRQTDPDTEFKMVRGRTIKITKVSKNDAVEIQKFYFTE